MTGASTRGGFGGLVSLCRRDWEKNKEAKKPKRFQALGADYQLYFIPDGLIKTT